MEILFLLNQASALIRSVLLDEIKSDLLVASVLFVLSVKPVQANQYNQLN